MNTKKELRTNLYNQNDSGLAFILALIVPQIILLLVVMLCSQISGLPFSSADAEVKTFVNTYKVATMLISALVPQISFLAVFVFVSERRKVNYKQANQFNFKLDWKVLLLVLGIGVVALFGFSPFINLLDHITSGWGYKSSVSNIDVSTVGKFVGAVFYIGLLPAICEELIFRGIITNGLKKYGTVAAVVISAIFFALMHQNLQQLLYQLFLGGVMAYIVIKTGSIVYTMLLHFFNNFFILFLAHLSGTESQTIDYSNAWNVIYPILLMIVSVASILGLLWCINYIQKRSKLKKQTDVLSQNSNMNIDNKENQEKLEDDKNGEINKDVSAKALKQEDICQINENIEQKESVKTILQNPVLVVAFVTGIVFWIFAVISSF